MVPACDLFHSLSILLSRQQVSGLWVANVISVYEVYLRRGVALVREESFAYPARSRYFSSWTDSRVMVIITYNFNGTTTFQISI